MPSMIHNYTVEFITQHYLVTLQRVINLCRHRGYALEQLHLSPQDGQGRRKVVMEVICEPTVFRQCHLRLERLVDVYDLTWTLEQTATAGSNTVQRA